MNRTLPGKPSLSAAVRAELVSPLRCAQPAMAPTLRSRPRRPLAAHGVVELSSYNPPGVDIDITPDLFVPSLLELASKAG